MLLTFLAVSLDILEKVAYTAHFEDLTGAFRDLCFDIDLFRTGLMIAKDCGVIASEIISKLQTEQKPRSIPTSSYSSFFIKSCFPYLVAFNCSFLYTLQ